MSSTEFPGTHAQVELVIEGMTCASCANRIERTLNTLETVEATVNFATEKARVITPVGYDATRLVAEVAKAGYRATLVQPGRAATTSPAARRGAEHDAPPSTGHNDKHDTKHPTERDVEQGAEHSAAHTALRARVIGAVVLAVPVMLLAMVPALQFTSWQWVSLALATPVVTWAAWPFHRAAWLHATHRTATMDTLVSLGVVTSYLWSLYALCFGGAGDPGMVHTFSLTLGAAEGTAASYLEVSAGVTMFLLLGRFIEQHAKRQAGTALRSLLELGAKEVTVLRNGTESIIPIDRLAVGDHIVVRPGEIIAADGVVVTGSSAVDAALLTGESTPVDVAVGDHITGATVNISGKLEVRATRVGADTQLAHMARLVEHAQTQKAQLQRLADRISGVFVPVVILFALLVWGAWLVAGFPVSSATTAAVAVLVIACPCALGLATPMAFLVGTGRGAQLGILITSPEALETTRTIDTVVLDKTGTVTTGTMKLVAVIPEPGTHRAELLATAGAVEHASEHPIAQAIARAAEQETGALAAVENFHNSPGLGVSGIVNGRTVLIGRDSFLTERAHQLSPNLSAAQAAMEQEGKTVVTVGWDGAARGILVVADTIKPTSAAAVRAMRALGLTPVLLTGDNETVARQIAAEVGIERVHAGVLPHEKSAVITRLQQSGGVVAMIGDGVNDAPALATADLGIAIGTGADIAIQAADITLVRGDLLAAVDAIRLSRSTLRTIRVNLFWAFAYNVAALPIAALGLLNPMLAGAAMALSSLVVVGNSLRLRRFRSVNTRLPEW